MKDKSYTREERIMYYAERIATTKMWLKQYEDKLAYIKSDKYQDWNSSVRRDLTERKKAR